MSVEAYFQSRAEQFDALYGPQPRWQRWWNHTFRAGLYERTALTLAELRGLENFSVLDVGCGSGRNSIVFAEAGARSVLGIDVASGMLEIAKRLTSNSGVVDKLTFKDADFFDAAFDEQFDVCVALGFFDYVRDPVPALRRMADLATRKIIASFPGLSLVRAPLRKLRYAVRGCPVYFYSQRRLHAIFGAAGLPQHRIVPCSSGFVVVAERLRGVQEPELADPRIAARQ